MKYIVALFICTLFLLSSCGIYEDPCEGVVQNTQK